MKGWSITSPLNIEQKEIDETISQDGQIKIRLTKSMITLSDVLRYNGEVDSDGVVLGSSGIGVVSEAEEKSSIVGVQIDGLGYACVKIAKNYLTC